MADVNVDVSTMPGSSDPAMAELAKTAYPTNNDSGRTMDTSDNAYRALTESYNKEMASKNSDSTKQTGENYTIIPPEEGSTSAKKSGGQSTTNSTNSNSTSTPSSENNTAVTESTASVYTEDRLNPTGQTFNLAFPQGNVNQMRTMTLKFFNPYTYLLKEIETIKDEFNQATSSGGEGLTGLIGSKLKDVAGGFLKNEGGNVLDQFLGAISGKTQTAQSEVEKFFQGDTNILFKMVCPLPSSLSESISHNYNKQSMLEIFKSGADFASDFVDSVGKATDTIHALKIPQYNNNYTGYIPQAPLMDKFEIQKYEGSEHRAFTFGWEFMPQSEAEATTINQAIYYLKRFGSPMQLGVKLLIVPPARVIVEFPNKIIEKMLNIAPCAIENISITYGNDSMTTYQDGNFKSCKIEIQIKEFRVKFMDDYDTDWSGTNAGTSMSDLASGMMSNFTKKISSKIGGFF